MMASALRSMLRSAALAASLAPASLFAQIPNPGTYTDNYCPKWTASLPEATPGRAYSASLGTNLNGSLTSVMASAPWLATPMPNGFTLDGSNLAGTPLKPGYTEFTVQLPLKNSCPGATGTGTGLVLRHTFTVKVRDVVPPQISAFTVTPATVGAAGGSVVVSVGASDDMQVTRAMLTTQHPDGHKGSALMQPPPNVVIARSGEWTLTVPLPANTGTTPAVYTFTVAVDDSGGSSAHAGPITATVQSRGATPLPVIRR